MLGLVYIFVFVFCLAIAIAAAVMAYQAIHTYDTPFHKNYFYYLLNFYAFAFYGIWGQILMRIFLALGTKDDSVITTAANFLPVLGVPFLFVSWIMLVRMGYFLEKVTTTNTKIGIYAALCAVFFTLIVGLFMGFFQENWLQGETLAYTEMGLMSAIEMVIVLVFLKCILKNTRTYTRAKRSVINRFLVLTALALILRLTVLPLLFIHVWLVPAVMLLYFLSNFFPLFYLRLNSDVVFVPVFAGRPSKEKKELLFEKYGITKREREIVEAICDGLTNQQIADRLFISLQTVKDHTHRIYSKIGINSRMKLVQLING